MKELRIFKTKTKISGGFRSIEAAQDYANVLLVVKTSVKRKINPKAIFNNEILFAKIKSNLT